ncbi:MAG: hypothetical protein R2778_01040 [Saprospiraceae bacterium]
MLKNGNFSEGVVAVTGYSGAINDWSLFPNSGLGTVYVDTTGEVVMMVISYLTVDWIILGQFTRLLI